MFYHPHPYPPFIPKNAKSLLVGTLPPPRFVTKKLLEGDVDFCYGSNKGQLWPILAKIFSLDLSYENTDAAITQRKQFLIARKLGICDIVDACYRQKIDASDLGMEQVKLRNVLKYLTDTPTVNTLLFTGGNSKNGPEFFFRQLLKKNKSNLTLINSDSPKIHHFKLGHRTLKTVSLTAPSGAANRAVGSSLKYKNQKRKDPAYTTFDYRVDQYREFF